MSDTVSTSKPCEYPPCQTKCLEFIREETTIPESRALRQPISTTNVGEVVPEEDCNKVLEGRPLLYSGVIVVGALKKFMIPTACSAAAAVITTSTDKKEPSEPSKIRPSELPIYSKEPAPPPKCDPHLSPDSVLHSSVRQIRKCIWTLIDEGKVLGQQACDYLETGKAHTASTLAFLREEENRVPRYGAIGIGGLAGFVLALRRGKFKKVLYTTAGATAMAALCYPKEAEQYTSEGLKLAKQYIIIGYHFVNGVLRDYAGVQLPPLPKPLLGNNSSETVTGNEVTVPSSSTLLPSPAATSSQLGPIPMPPIDVPSNVTDADPKVIRTKKETRDQSNPDDRDLYAKRG